MALAVCGEFGNVQLAAVQVFVAGGDAVGGATVGCRPVGRRHKLVDVFALRIIAHVHRQRLAHHWQAECAAFVRKPAERCAFSNGNGFVVRVNLDHVAEGIELVAVVVCAVRGCAGLRQVPAGVLVGLDGIG